MVPIGIATDGRWVLESGDPEPAADHRPATSCPRSTASRATVALARRTGATDLVVHEPSAASADARRGRRRLPAAARSVGRGRHHPGDARDGRRPLRRRGRAGLAVGMDKAYMKVVLAARRPAGDAVDHRHRARVVPRPGRLHAARRRARLPGVREARPRRLVASASPRRTTPPSSPTRSRRRTATTPRRWSRSPPRAPARSSAACSRAATARPETSLPAEIRITGDHEFYDFAAKYLPEEQHRARRPRRPPRRRRRPAARPGGPGLRGGRLRGPGPRRLLRDPDGRWSSTRSTRCPGSRRPSMFPRMWAATGLDYPALVDRLIKLALHRDTGLR